MQRLFTIGLCLWLAIVGFSAGGIAYAQTPVVIKTALVTPEGSTWTQTLRRMAGDIQQQTDGQIQFKIYAGGVSGDEADVLRMMRAGRIHAAGFSGVGLGIVLPSIRLLEAPMLFRNHAEVDLATQALFDAYAEGFAQKGFVLLGFAESGFVYMFTRLPPTSAAALQQNKMWVWKGDSVAQQFLSGLKVRTVPLQLADVNTGLETGMIDGFYSPPLAAIAFQWHSRVGFMIDVPIVNATGALLMNRGVFNRLSGQQQDTLTRLARQYCRQLVEQTRRENAEAKTALTAAGVKTVVPSHDLLERMNQSAEETRRQSIPDLYSQQQYRELLQRLQSHRKGVAPAAQPKP